MFLFATLWQQPFVEMFLNHPVLWADLTFFSTIIVRPRWTVEPTDKQFAQGSDAKIDCKADGFPQPKISWKKAVGKKFYFLFFIIFVLNYIRSHLLQEFLNNSYGILNYWRIPTGENRWLWKSFRILIGIHQELGYHLLIWQNSD